jgi:hypothetical protein
MKKLSLYTAIIASAITLVSCKPSSTLQRDIRYMDIRFKPLGRNDVTLVGNLQAEVTISGKGTMMDKSFAQNAKVGKFYKEQTNIMYFAPASGEAITGSLYETNVFESVSTTASLGQKRQSLFQSLFPGLYAQKRTNPYAAPTPVDFGYYALVEKYPDVDYFINVRFDKKHILSGSKWTETVIVKADGVKLKTD